MIIESIEIFNFMCYSGHNKFEFKEGMNVIIGDNGYGKSKLYDAFYWAMYDQCFDTNDKKWKGSRFIGRSIISDKAVFEAQDELIRTSVKLTFNDVNKDEQYIIERILTAKKNGDDVIPDNDSVEEVTHRIITGMQGKLKEDPDEIERIKRKILPNNIRPYMWFQGEQVESIIDFGESDSLTQAINVLSNISRFDEISEVATAWEKSASDQYHRKVKSLSSDKTKSDKLEAERENVVERIELLEKSIKTIKDNLGHAEEEADKLINMQELATSIREMDIRRKSLESQLQQTVEDERHERIGLHKNLFKQRWVLKGTEGLVKAYNDKFGKYNDIKLQRLNAAKLKLDAENEILKELQSRLPINVPEPIHVEKMLELELCLVCDRKAEKGSDAYNRILELLKRSQSKPKELVDEISTNYDFDSDFRRLSQHGYAMELDIKRIDSNVKESFTNLSRLEKRRKSFSKELAGLEKKMENVVTESSLDPERAKDLLSRLQANHDHAKRFSENLSREQMQLQMKKDQLAKIDRDLGELVKGAIPKYLEEKKGLLSDFLEIAKSTRERVFKDLVQQLEDEANKHYLQMMQSNLSAQGIIKLVESSKGNFMPRLVDEEGNPLMQLNTGNIILIKLATIMAIISARQGSRATDLYTLITDAPMSVFGEDYTIGFCKTVSSVYRQSIIMSKEFYKNEDLRRQLLNDKEINLGMVYKITPSIPESDRSNRNNLSTIIEALN